jgi:hypothetical protein
MNTITKIGVEGSNILYLDLNREQFINNILNSNRKLLDYNKDSYFKSW